MSSIRTICPNGGCDKDISLDAARIKRALLRKGQMNGKALIGCPECAHVMVLPDIPSEDTLFEQWATDAAEKGNEIECVPFIDSLTLILPNGHTDQAGTTMYTPGSGGQALDKYQYMLKFGIDPSIAEYASGKPVFKIE